MAQLSQSALAMPLLRSGGDPLRLCRLEAGEGLLQSAGPASLPRGGKAGDPSVRISPGPAGGREALGEEAAGPLILTVFSRNLLQW